MDPQKGWMEQRRHERVSATLHITYRVLGAEEKDQALSQSKYSETTAEHLPHLSKKFHAYHAVTKDISEGGLSITGEHPFNEGDKVELSIQLPQYNVPITILAEVKRCVSYVQLGKTIYSAGVSILALDKDDMNRLGRYLLAEKVRQRNEKKD